MASNEYNDMTELIKEYYDVPVGTYLNQSISINGVTLVCDIYRVEPETVLTPSVFIGCTAVDANTQIVIGKNMSVASGTTLTPPYRCKGIVIGDVGTFTNEGTISMTARGASGEGKNIQLTEDYMISAVGGAGGASATRSGSYGSTSGNSGSSPSSGILSCGGGGSGSLYLNLNASTVTSGAGASGTSFSGGAGGGGIASSPTLTGFSAQSNGGAGGNARVNYNNKEEVNDFYQVTGGAGNPNGTNLYNSYYYTLNTRGTGAGGLIVIMASKIVSSGSFESQGSQADYVTYTPPSGKTIQGYQFAIGGSSGGGCIVLLSRERNVTGTYSVISSASTGGTNNTSGGAGGAGVYASYIVEDLILQNLPVEIAISDTNHLDNIEPSEGVRLLGMMDDDELYYEIMGTRHSSGSGHILEDEEGTALTKRKALAINSPLTVEDDSVNEKTDLGVDTDVDLSVIHAPGTSHNATDGSPVGTIISFFGYAAPSGYLVCDGTEYAKADYPYLATHLADLDDHYSTTQYVGSDTDHFKVPDLRGEFLRGTGTNSHTNSILGNAEGSGSNVGVHQQATSHRYYQVEFSNGVFGFTNNPGNAGDFDGQKVLGKMKYSNTFTHETPDPPTGGNYPCYFTSRPTNTSVLYCIKCN